MPSFENPANTPPVTSKTAARMVTKTIRLAGSNSHKLLPRSNSKSLAHRASAVESADCVFENTRHGMRIAKIVPGEALNE